MWVFHIRQCRKPAWILAFRCKQRRCALQWRVAAAAEWKSGNFRSFRTWSDIAAQCAKSLAEGDLDRGRGAVSENRAPEGRGRIRAGIRPRGRIRLPRAVPGMSGPGCPRGRTGSRCARSCRCAAEEGQNDTGRGCPNGDIRAPGSGARRAAAGPAYMPAARSWSRSTLDDAGKFCGRFSPSAGRASSWRCFTTVRLATMAARAIKPTPKVRISASRSESPGAPCGATCTAYQRFPCRTIVRFPRGPRGDPFAGRKPPSLLAIRPYNARDACFLTAPGSRVCRRQVTPPRCRLSTMVDVRRGCSWDDCNGAAEQVWDTRAAIDGERGGKDAPPCRRNGDLAHWAAPTGVDNDE